VQYKYTYITSKKRRDILKQKVTAQALFVANYSLSNLINCIITKWQINVVNIGGRIGRALGALASKFMSYS